MDRKTASKIKTHIKQLDELESAIELTEATVVEVTVYAKNRDVKIAIPMKGSSARSMLRHRQEELAGELYNMGIVLDDFYFEEDE